MTDKLKVALGSILTGVVAVLAAYNINLDFLSTEMISGIAAALAAGIAMIFGSGKKDKPAQQPEGEAFEATMNEALKEQVNGKTDK